MRLRLQSPIIPTKKFILQAKNKNGTVKSEALTVDPLYLRYYIFDPKISHDIIEVEFVNEYNQVMDGQIAENYEIHSLNQYITHPVKSGSLEETNLINIESLNKGLYVLQVKDKQNKTYSIKFQK